MFSVQYLAGLLSLAGSCATQAEPLVRLSGSKITYRGIVLDGVEHFQNIKFAHNTSGVRRFAPPEPYIPLEGTVIDATSPGHACPGIQDAMPPFFSQTGNMSEDCLNLRIARPAGLELGPKSKLPVVVWVHGGGVVKGSAYDPHFDPDNLVKLSVPNGKPIIYTAINYRLTIFGFARLSTLKDQKSLNVGMRDQRVGIEWIKDNIANFGGDPDRITAYGLSAGGTFISTQLMTYGGEKGVPFTQAWVMSGPPGTVLNMTTDATEIHTRAVADQLKCGKDDNSKTLECLREIPMNELLSTAMKYSVANHPPAGLFTFIPSVDDEFLPDRQSVLYKAGRFVKNVPVVFGWTQDDGAINAGPGHLIQKEEDMIPPIRNYAHALTSDQLSTLFSQYEPADFEEDVLNYEARKGPDDPAVSVHFFRLSRILRDMLFTCSSIEFSKEIMKQSTAKDAKFPGARLYYLNQSMLTPLWKGAGMPYVGVAHGSDTNYIFNGLFPEGQVSESDRKLSESFSQSFIHFAYTGNPSSPQNEDFSDWAEVQSGVAGANNASDLVHLLVVGGPHGSGSVSLTEQAGQRVEGPSSRSGTQQVLGEGFEYGEMATAASQRRKWELERERLLQRCAYVNSLAETLGN